MVVKKKSTLKSVSPDAVKDAPLVDEFTEAGEEFKVYSPPTYTVKLGTKKFDERSIEQVQALILGSSGKVKRITIEME